MHFRKSQKIHRAADSQCRKRLCTNTPRLSLVYDGDSFVSGGVSYRRRFAILQSRYCWSDNKFLEVSRAQIIERYDFNGTGPHQFTKQVCILPPARPTFLEFARNDVDHYKPLRKCSNNSFCTAAGIKVNDRTRVRDKK
jgi:hypothetical protein